MAQTNYSATVLYPLILPSGFEPGSEVLSPASPGQAVVAGQAVSNGINAATANSQNALVWTTPGGLVTDLNPAGFTTSYALATDGAQQVGFGTANATDDALLWSGTAASAVILNPSGISDMIAVGIGGGQEVGYGDVPSADLTQHAFLWSGTAASAVDLTPTLEGGRADALATDGVQQVGYYKDSGSSLEAMLWSGTAASAVNLNPTNLPGILLSAAIAVGGAQQVGFCIEPGGDNYTHAVLWSGTGASAVDLNPTGLTGLVQSIADGTNGFQQVGYGTTLTNLNEALLWSGSAGSAIDLQSLLPSVGTWTQSMACSIDPMGNVYGIATGTLDGVTGNFAVEWSPVPEPGTVTLLAAFAAGLLMRRRRTATLRRSL
ncbi:MAG: PEP-CTERM sorting domain-containing protein [Tepidisphaeraceae bacterium]